MQVPDSYKGREQAFIKHSVLKAYLPKLFMIIGNGRESVINYVDCFAGPWQENDERLSDTSIGISLAELASCRQALFEIFGKTVHFRALYIEADPKAFGKLQTFLTNARHEGIETKCLHGDYTEKLAEIAQWCGPHFTFFFVDPKGWLDIIGADVMRPLLALQKSEFLINLMYDFVNRAASIDRHQEDMVALFGKAPPLQEATPEERQAILLKLYRDTMSHVHGGRSTYVSIQKPGKERVHYFLVYLTRSSVGLIKFKEIAESTEALQRQIQVEVRVNSRTDKTGVRDLFEGESQQTNLPTSFDIIANAKTFLRNKFSGQVVRIDKDLWADLLEKTDFFPSEIQTAMKSLVADGLVENLDKDIGRRPKNVVNPGYPEKSERWRFKS